MRYKAMRIITFSVQTVAIPGQEFAESELLDRLQAFGMTKGEATEAVKRLVSDGALEKIEAKPLAKTEEPVTEEVPTEEKPKKGGRKGGPKGG